MFRLFMIGLLSLVIATTCFGQDKIGTIAATFLNLVPEARSVGMGGITVSTGNYSDVYWNPAILGLNVDGTRYRLSLSPKGASGHSNGPWLNNYSVLCPGFGKLVGIEFFALGIGTYVTRLKSSEMIEYTSISSPGGSGKTFSWKEAVYGLSCGVGYEGDRIQLAVGCAAKLVREWARDYSAEGLAFDIGGVLRGQIVRNRRAPLLGALDISSLIGMSLTNLGEDLKISSNTYPLPRAVHIGISLECASARKDGSTYRAWSALVSTEYHKLQVGSHERQVIVGLEIEALSTIALRIGDNVEEDHPRTWGFGVSSVGIASLLPDNTSGLGSLLRNHLNITFDFVKAVETVRYYQISIGYR